VPGRFVEAAMKVRTRLIAFVALVLGSAALATTQLRARAGDDDVAFPRDFGLLYATVDRAEFKQLRELYAPATVIAALKDGKPFPPGAVLVMIQYEAKRDSAGQPLTDAGGRFIKDRLIAYLVMEKRGDARAERGNWRFQIFGADKRVDASAKLSDCVACHQQRRAHDFVFTGERMKAFLFESAIR
jgi:hypothetical protein